jgi:HAE1 family hydrophobic/amphiphilic exporter-1
MILSDIAIRRPVFTTMAITAIIVFGLVARRSIGVDLIPKIDFPVISVTSVLPGADPETVETTVSEPIEEAVSTIAAIKKLHSVSSDSVSQVIIQFELEKNVDIAFQEVTAKIAGIKRDLPTDLEEPVVAKFDPDSMPIMALVISGDKSIRELTHVADKVVKTRLQQVRNVGQVVMVGGRDREMWVWLDRGKLEGHGLAVSDVIGTLRGEHVEYPGGRVETGDLEYVVKTKAECETAAEFGDLVVAYRGGAAIRLRDVSSRIEDGLQEERSLSKLGDRRAVSLLIRRQSGTNTLEVSDAVSAEIGKLQQELAPQGIHLEKAKELGPFIVNSLDEINTHLLIGGALAVLLVFCFLRDWRITLISALAIPTAVIGAFTFISALGFTLNVITMLALSLSIGLFIDDAIVVIENIYRHYEGGMKPREAAKFGTDEIGMAAFSITMSIVAVFVPVAFMGGIVGRMFYQFGMTVVCGVLLSLFVAFTLTPMLASRMLHHHGAGGWFYRLIEVPLKGLERWYGILLGGALRQRLLTIGVALAALVAAVGVSRFIRTEFKPQEDQSEFSINVKAALGSSLATTEAICDRIRTRLEGQPWLESVFTTIGAGGLQRVNEAELYVKMPSKAARRRLGTLGQFEAMAWARQRIADISEVKVSVGEVDRISGGSGFKQAVLQMDLRGPDLTALAAAAERVLERMRRAGGYTDLDLSYETGKPEVHLFIKRDRAADLGVSTMTIASAVKTLIGGDQITKFKSAGDRYDVSVRLDDGLRNRPDDILDLSVRNQRGQLVSLRNLVEVRQESGPVQIDRYNRQRQVTILANLVQTKATADTRTLVQGEANGEVQRFCAEADLPADSGAYLSGMGEIMVESFGYLQFALILAVALVYMVLASQFESFIHPFTIMLSLPLAVVGALGLLVAIGATQSIFTMIGIIMLMGLVTKNAILLVDYTNTLRRRDGLERTAALRRAGPVRLRPILMTTLAVICGMLPIAFGRGPGSESRSPMAFTMIGGLVTSTLLTLVVVPVVYSLLDDFGAWIKRLLGLGKTAGTE